MDTADDRVVTLPELMNRKLERHPDAVALIVDGEQYLHYAEWDRRADAVARALLDRGVRPGDRVALLAAALDWIEYAVAYLAAKKVAAATVHLSEALAPTEIERRLALCEVSGVLCTSGVTAPEQVRRPADAWVATVGALESESASGDPVRVTGDPGELAEIIFTSGTTGDAKAIAVTTRMLTWGLDLEDDVVEIEGVAELALYGNPIGSSPGMIVVMTPMVAHPPVALAVTRHDPDFLGGLIERLRVQALYVPPAIAGRLADAAIDERHDLSSVVEFTTSSSALPVPVTARLAEMFPNATMNRAYVSLESVPAFTRITTPPWATHPDRDYFRRPEAASVGTPRFGARVSIRDAEGKELPPGQVGEIWLHTPAPQRRYYRSPEANARTYVDGWVRMGDLGHVGEDGLLYVFDRVADAIPAAHRLISTLPGEAALLRHPAVSEAAVFGTTDPVTGHQVPAAAVVLRSPATDADLAAFAAGLLPPDEVPVVFHRLETLPRGTLGKVLKRELRRRFPTAPLPVTAP